MALNVTINVMTDAENQRSPFNLTAISQLQRVSSFWGPPTIVRTFILDEVTSQSEHLPRALHYVEAQVSRLYPHFLTPTMPSNARANDKMGVRLIPEGGAEDLWAACFDLWPLVTWLDATDGAVENLPAYPASMYRGRWFVGTANGFSHFLTIPEMALVFPAQLKRNLLGGRLPVFDYLARHEIFSIAGLVVERYRWKAGRLDATGEAAFFKELGVYRLGEVRGIDPRIGNTFTHDPLCGIIERQEEALLKWTQRP